MRAPADAPLGHLRTVALLATATLFALRPRGRRDIRTVSYYAGPLANELPLLVLAILPASTLLTLGQGDIDDPAGPAAVAGLVIARILPAWRRTPDWARVPAPRGSM